MGAFEMRAVRRAGQVLISGCAVKRRSNRAATLLAFGARTAVTAASTAGSATTTTTATAATITVASATAAPTAAPVGVATLAAFAALFTVAALALVVALTATIVAITATTAALLAAAVTAARTLVASLGAAARRGARSRGLGLAAAEDALQPANETGLFRRLGRSRRRAWLLLMAWLALRAAVMPTVVAARLTPVATLAAFAVVSAIALAELAALLAFAARSLIARIEGTAFAAFPTLSLAALALTALARLERGPLVALGRLTGIGRRGTVFPAHRRAFDGLGRQNIEFGLGLRRACGLRQRIRLRRLSGGRGARRALRRIQGCG